MANVGHKVSDLQFYPFDIVEPQNNLHKNVVGSSERWLKNFLPIIIHNPV